MHNVLCHVHYRYAWSLVNNIPCTLEIIHGLTCPDVSGSNGMICEYNVIVSRVI